MIYASMGDSTEIYVNTANQDHYVPGPPGWGPCTGITVDQTYLWLYQPFGFAVVSHASVLSHSAAPTGAPLGARPVAAHRPPGGAPRPW